MARLSDATTMTEELTRLVRRLHDEVAGGRSDLADLSVLADDVAASADSLAATFTAIDRELGRLSDPDGGGERDEASASEESDVKPKPKRQAPKRHTRTGQRGRRRASTTASSGGPSSGADDDEPTREELLEQAKEADIPGRSSMSKEELAEAVEAQEHQTKDELLEQAKALGVAGRSEMSKQELLEAVRTEASVSRDELLDRAKEAEIPGRSEMSKEELREALQPR